VTIHRVHRRTPPHRPGVSGAGRASFTGPVLTALALLALAGAAVAGAAACGGSSGARPVSATSGSPPESTPSPLANDIVFLSTPVEAKRAIGEFWKALAADRSEDLRAVTTTAFFDFTQGSRTGIARAKARHIGKPVDPPPQGCNLEVPVDVYVWPDGEDTPWGDAGVHRVWMKMVGYSDGSWLVSSTGTSP